MCMKGSAHSCGTEFLSPAHCPCAVRENVLKRRFKGLLRETGMRRAHAQSKTRGLFAVKRCYVSTRYRLFDLWILSVRVSTVSDNGQRNDPIFVRCSAERFPRFFDAIHWYEF